ncbi:MAG TPA: DNA polymerase Y family protein [Ilumatobacteraceae bacterium]|nr:DNA polymerase Y family protein [Ilumatobacteraceae bacterium]
MIVPRIVPGIVPRIVPRIVTVWCPDWPVVAAGVAPTVPAAVLRANRVIARSPAAALAGVRSGHRRREAQRCCPELIVLDHDPARDARQFEAVIRAVAELSPRLDVVEPGWLCLAARGPSRYFGGDEALAERLTAVVTGVLDSLGLASAPVGVGVADGRVAATIAARRADVTIAGPAVVAPGESASYLAGLTVGWLREVGEAAPELVELFIRLGLSTLGDLAALPAGDVYARFGSAGLHVHRLAGGGDDRPPGTTDPPAEWSTERAFGEPVEHLETVVFVAKQLADELVATLAGGGRVCTRVIVIAETEHGERSERAWYRAVGLSSSAIVERVRWQLEGWIAQPGALTGGVTLLRLVPDQVRGDDGDQLGLWGGRSQADHDAMRAVTRLTGLFGEQAVCVPAWRGGRLPAERYQWVSAAAADLEDPSGRLSPGDGPWPGGSPRPSPSVVFTEPLDVEVVDEQGGAIRVSGRGEVSASPAALVVRGAARPLRAWAGPWLIDQRWWEPRRHRRVAQFQVVTDDGEAYLVAAEQQQWWILAAYA